MATKRIFISLILVQINSKSSNRANLFDHWFILFDEWYRYKHKLLQQRASARHQNKRNLLSLCNKVFNPNLMTTYIALLRAINVSGKNKITMEVLKQLLLHLGFTQVQTYIQSGNVIFQSEETNANQITSRIEQAITEQLGLIVAVITLPLVTFQTILDHCPFKHPEEQAQLYITFFNAKPAAELELTTLLSKKAPEEHLVLTDSAAYFVAANGYGKTKITNALLEQKLGIVATTRNYKTCLTLLKLAALQH